ncbi:MAG: succinate dehydrogenase iron-sulfur subunit [Candidatus Caldarchaeum sp.]|nr:succinate dehydrogenase iron-sulfur subunit [Candidatus Caldarchaeum sp.]MDW8063347.1 succinate dehydrogenase iron-sulfur subunit [Candidatus Caldarchaeum sp.]
MEEVKFKVLRYDPDKDGKKRFQEFRVPIRKGMTVLQGLLHIKEKIDPTLSIRFSCRMATCGSCGMMINGLPRLACYTLIEELKTRTVVVEPLRNFPIVKDLVTDFEEFFNKHRSVKPYLIRIDTYVQEKSNTMYLQSDEELVRYVQFAYCIKCGLCYAACPVVATDKTFLGPQALAQAYRYYADSRDEAGVDRLKPLGDGSSLLRCHFAASCSQVCPKGVDPALAIQLLRKEVLLRS